MSAIVRYGPSAIRAYRMYAPRVRRAIARSRAAYARGRRIYRGARKAFRTAKRISGQKRKILARARKIGEKRNSSATKRLKTVDQNIAVKSTRTLYSHDLTAIDKNVTSQGEPNKRNRNVLTIKGFKLCMEIENRLNQPLYFNWAIISPKADSPTHVPNNGFFRSDGVTRQIDFNANTLNSQDYHCLPINADKYVILTHQRRMLASSDAVSPEHHAGNQKSYKYIDKWIPLKRQIRYEGNSATSNRTKVFLVYWCDEFLKGVGSPGQVQTNALQIQKRVLTYFVEPGSTL